MTCLSEYGRQLTTWKQTADYFEAVVKEAGVDAKEAANWMLGDPLLKLNEAKTSIFQAASQTGLTWLALKLIAKGTISARLALEKSCWKREVRQSSRRRRQRTGSSITDTGALQHYGQKVIAVNPQSVADHKAGKKKAIGFPSARSSGRIKGRANFMSSNQLLTGEFTVKDSCRAKGTSHEGLRHHAMSLSL